VSETEPRRRVSLRVVVLAAVVVLGVYVYWSQGANERRVDALLEMGYDYTELGGDQPTKLNHVESLQLGEAICGDLDDWYGAKTARKSVDGVDILAAAEIAARRFESEGWAVERFSVDAQTPTPNYVLLSVRDTERFVMSFFPPGGISILVQAGPCVPRAGGVVIQRDVPIDEFPA